MATLRIYGQFFRQIPLPKRAKVDQATAEFHNGLLEVTVPVPETESKRRQIPITSQTTVESSASQSQERTRTTAGAR